MAYFTESIGLSIYPLTTSVVTTEVFGGPYILIKMREEGEDVAIDVEAGNGVTDNHEAIAAVLKHVAGVLDDNDRA